MNRTPYDAPCDDDTPCPFKPHKGIPLCEVPAGFLLWLYTRENFIENNPGLANYISENMEALTARKKDETAEYFKEKERAARVEKEESELPSPEIGSVINFDEE